jgi:hypothetical protein
MMCSCQNASVKSVQTASVISFYSVSEYKLLIFVVPCIMLYSGEISRTKCNNCVFLFFIRVLVSKFRLLGVDEFNICGSVHHALQW